MFFFSPPPHILCRCHFTVYIFAYAILHGFSSFPVRFHFKRIFVFYEIHWVWFGCSRHDFVHLFRLFSAQSQEREMQTHQLFVWVASATTVAVPCISANNEESRKWLEFMIRFSRFAFSRALCLVFFSKTKASSSRQNAISLKQKSIDSAHRLSARLLFSQTQHNCVFKCSDKVETKQLKDRHLHIRIVF